MSCTFLHILYVFCRFLEITEILEIKFSKNANIRSPVMKLQNIILEIVRDNNKFFFE